ncbi:MAG: DeoR/GlpR family DNA-binding transcription regulator, partial [Halanaerobiales bacterium]
ILQKEKKQIGREAAKLVEDNNVLVLDEGTTVSRMIEFVVQKNNLEIFTCDFSIANTLMEYKNNGIFNGEIYFVGGKVNSKHQRTSGFLSQKFMDSFHVDKVFFTTTGLIPEYGLSDYYYDKGLLTKKFIDIADEKILLADHSKIGVKTTFSFCELEKINYIISDVSMPSNFKENIKDIKWIKAE